MLGDKVHRINFTIGHDDYMLFVVASIASSSISSTCVRLFGIALMLVSMPCSLLTSKCSDALHSTFSAHSNVDFLGNFYYLFFPVFSRCRGTLIFWISARGFAYYSTNTAGNFIVEITLSIEIFYVVSDAYRHDELLLLLLLLLTWSRNSNSYVIKYYKVTVYIFELYDWKLKIKSRISIMQGCRLFS